MFGIGFFEFVVIAIVGLMVLGPDKLPQAAIKMVKIFKMFSKSINEAKSAIEEELNIQQLKEDSQKYRALLEQNTQKITKSLNLEEISSSLQNDVKEVNSAIEELKSVANSNQKAEEKPAVKKRKSAKKADNV